MAETTGNLSSSHRRQCPQGLLFQAERPGVSPQSACREPTSLAIQSADQAAGFANHILVGEDDLALVGPGRLEAARLNPLDLEEGAPTLQARSVKSAFKAQYGPTWSMITSALSRIAAHFASARHRLARLAWVGLVLVTPGSDRLRKRLKPSPR